MSDEFVNIPFDDVTERMEAPDHLRPANPQGHVQRPQGFTPERRGNRITITLPAGLEFSEELKSAIFAAVQEYMESNKEQILATMLGNLKVAI